MFLREPRERMIFLDLWHNNFLIMMVHHEFTQNTCLVISLRVQDIRGNISAHRRIKSLFFLSLSLLAHSILLKIELYGSVLASVLDGGFC